MKNLFTLLTFVFFSISAFAQITFEKGYFIKNNDEKVICLIKNEDWKNYPTEIEYKLSNIDAVESITITEMKAFGIDEGAEFIRFTGNVDVSGNTASRYSAQKKPEFEQQTIFLKVLIKGSAASLYHYNKKQIERFYYQMNDSEIEPLIYKIYSIEQESKKISAINAKFRRQLLVSMQCESMTMKDVDRLSYTKSGLIKYFVKYHECLGKEVSVSKDKKYSIHLALEAGYNSQFFDFRDLIFESEWETKGYAPRFGTQIEATLPFNKNKWSVFLGGTYRYMNVEDSITNTLGNTTIDRNYQLTYQSIECNLGFRYYMFLNENSKFFIDAAYIADFPFNSSLTSTGDFGVQSSLDINVNAAFGLGFQYKNVALTFRHHLSKDIISAPEKETNYGTTGISIRYYLF